jgi:hypothetical protein
MCIAHMSPFVAAITHHIIRYDLEILPYFQGANGIYCAFYDPDWCMGMDLGCGVSVVWHGRLKFKLCAICQAISCWKALA